MDALISLFCKWQNTRKGTEGKQISICLADVAVVLFSAFTSFNISVAFIYIGWSENSCVCAGELEVAM